MTGQRALRGLVLVFAVLASAHCGGKASGSDAGFVAPQIYPDNNPVCLSSRIVAVGELVTQNVLLENEGMQALQIKSATIAMDARRSFSLMGPDLMTVQTFESAILQLRYAPTAPGWDAIDVEVTSNAQNYPRLDVYVVARAVPAGLDGGAYDAGPEPSTAKGSCAKVDAGML